MSEEKELYVVGNEKETVHDINESPKNFKELNTYIESLVTPGEKPHFFIGSQVEYNLSFLQKVKSTLAENIEEAEEAFRESLVLTYTDLLFSLLQEESVNRERVQGLVDNLTRILKHNYR